MDPEIDASIFAHCYNIGPPQQAMTAMTNRAQKRQRPEHQLRQMPMGMRMHPQLPQVGMGMATYSQQQNGDPMRLMGRLLLQQEETIARLRKDKCFVLFLKHEQEGVLRPLMQVSKEWHLKQAEATTAPTTPLRTLLMQSMLQELQKRMQKEMATETTQAALLKKGWINSEGNWVYLRWDRTTKQLIQDPNRPALQHTEAIRLLSWMMKELHGDIIQRFSSTPGLQKVEAMTVPASTFHLEVSLRGQTSLEMYEAFSTFSANAATHLVGVSIKKDNLHQTKLAKQLADIVYPKRR